jgi:SAM-dependent methyltransferase
MVKPENDILDFRSLDVITTVSPHDDMYGGTLNNAAQLIALRPKTHWDEPIERLGYSSAAPSGPSAEISLVKPTGVQKGDLLLAVIASSFSYTGVTPPPGWTKIVSVSSVAAIMQLDSYYKVIEGNEPVTWTWGLNNKDARSTGSLIVYRRVDPTDPIVTSSGNSGTLGPENSALSITTEVPNCVVVGVFGEGLAVATYEPPSGFSAIQSVTNAEPVFGNYHMVCDKNFSTSGMTGDQVAVSAEHAYVDQYFRIGGSGLRQIILAMLAARKEEFNSILDLPCGYGRFLRHIKARFPNAKLTSCDLDRDAVDFCVKTFGATGVYSKENVREVAFDEKFDLIWCASIFTHLDSDRWFEWLEFVSDHLEEGGVLVFTTHGRFHVKMLQEKERDYGLDQAKIPDILGQYERTGFGYLAYPANPGYGVSISAPSWVVAEIERHPRLRVVSFTEFADDHHHDVVACVRC